MEKIEVKCPFYRVYRSFTVRLCDNLVSGVPACVVDDFYPDWGCEDEAKVAEWLAGVPEPEICRHFVRSDLWHAAFPVKKSECLFGGFPCVHPESRGFSACNKSCFVRSNV
jgi:hypothetical protein